MPDQPNNATARTGGNWRGDRPQLSEGANEALRWMGESGEAGRLTDQERWKLCCQRWGEGVRAELDALKLRSIAKLCEPAPEDVR